MTSIEKKLQKPSKDPKEKTVIFSLSNPVNSEPLQKLKFSFIAIQSKQICYYEEPKPTNIKAKIEEKIPT